MGNAGKANSLKRSFGTRVPPTCSSVQLLSPAVLTFCSMAPIHPRLTSLLESGEQVPGNCTAVWATPLNSRNELSKLSPRPHTRRWLTVLMLWVHAASDVLRSLPPPWLPLTTARLNGDMSAPHGNRWWAITVSSVHDQHPPCPLPLLPHVVRWSSSGRAMTTE